MKAFECQSGTVADFLKRVETSLRGRDLGDITTFTLQGQELKVTFSKLGTTELKYKVESRTEGFRADLIAEKVAFTHRPLKADIAAKLARVMEREGARCTL